MIAAGHPLAVDAGLRMLERGGTAIDAMVATQLVLNLVEPSSSGIAGGAFLLIAATLAIFFVWTYPANQATQNWTAAPANWTALRAQWEDAHAAGAVLTFAALCLVTASGLATREVRSR